MRQCDGCANDQEGYGCKTMLRRPPDRKCFMTKEKAIEAENAVLRYIDKELKKPISADERFQIRKRRKAAEERIQYLEETNV